MSDEKLEETIEAEFEEVPGSELVRHERPAPQQAMSLFGSDEPAEVVRRAAETATALADVINSRNLYKNISGKKHVLVEGWTLLGSMLGVFPVMETCEPVELNGVKGYKATVAAQTRDGNVIGRATAFCMRNENRWRTADDYAVASMAQTRATSKCLRAPLGFVMTLAGYEATPEAEMPVEEQAAPQAPATISDETAARFAKGIALLDGKPGWSTDEVVATAAQTFKRPIKELSDLTETEALNIIAAMKQYGGVDV